MKKGIRGQAYHKFWVDVGPVKMKPWKRMSLMVDALDGRIPPLTLEATRKGDRGQ
jgi:hypothetical protein